MLTAHSKSGIKIILKQYLISIKMLKLKYEHRVLSVDIFLFIYLFIYFTASQQYMLHNAE